MVALLETGEPQLVVLQPKDDVELTTLAVELGEPCYSYGEVNLPVPNKGLRRFQVIRVVRKDGLARFQKDLGPAKSFTGDQFYIPGGDLVRRIIVHTVGQLMDMGEKIRNQPSASANRKVPDWPAAFRESQDWKTMRRKGRLQPGGVTKLEGVA